MATGAQVITEAKKHLGEKGTTFWAAYGLANVDWCCIFVWYVLKQCGASNLFYDGQKTAWVPTAQEWLAKHATKVSVKDAKAGDIVIFTWGGGSRDHIGFAVKPLSNGKLQTLEGNTGSSLCTSSSVMIRERTADVIYGIYRPKYEQEKKTVSYGEIRKYKCVQVCHGYKKAAVASGRIGKDANVGSVYSATAWSGDFVKIPYLDNGWYPTKGSGGVYLERIPKIRYVVTYANGVNVYKSHSVKSMKLDTVQCGSFLTITEWYGKWGYAPAVSGWVAMSCLSEEGTGTRLFRSAVINGKKLADAGTRYSADSPPKTLEGAIKAKKTDCAHFTSFSLQDEGILPKGQYIWLDKGIHGDGADDLLKSKKVKVIRNYGKTAKQARLPIGAVAGYGYKGGQHTHMCAGYTSAGNPLWMSGGVSDVNNKSYGPKRKPTYEDREIDVLILPVD